MFDILSAIRNLILHYFQQMKNAGRMVFQQKKVGPTLYVIVLPDGGDEIYTAVKQSV